MLDNLKLIHSRDSRDMLGAAERQWRQLGHAFGAGPGAGLPGRSVANVVFAGTDEAALAAELLRVGQDIGLPFEICPTYRLPSYTGPSSLVIVALDSESETGTRAAKDAMAEAEERGSQSIVLEIPHDASAGPVVLYWLKALASAVEAVGGLSDGTMAADLESCADWLKTRLAGWSPTVATGQNPAKQMALETAGKSAVVYSGPQLYPSALAWKSSINQYAKHIAWCGRYPEAGYDDLQGWTKQPVNKPYAVVDLRSDLDSPQIQKQFELSGRLLSGRRPSPLIVRPEGDTLLRQQLYTLALGQFTGIYLALLAGSDPSDSDTLAKFKKEIS